MSEYGWPSRRGHAEGVISLLFPNQLRSINRNSTNLHSVQHLASVHNEANPNGKG